jgi:hypothetical protein
VLTNDPSADAVRVYDRASNGKLRSATSYATDGVDGSTFGAPADGQGTPQEAGRPGSGCRAACSRRLHGHLADRSTFSRDKVCGDFVGPVALTELADLGVAGTEAFRATNKIRDDALQLDGDKLAVRPLPQVNGLTPPYGRVIPGCNSTPGSGTQPGEQARSSWAGAR